MTLYCCLTCTLHTCFKLFMLNTFGMSLGSGWTPSAKVCDVFITGVVNMAIGFVVVDLIL